MMKGKTITRLFLLSLPLWMGLGWGCSPKVDPADVAAQVAKQYYDYLLEGKYEAFVDGKYRPDSIPGSYRDQLVMN